MRILGTNFYWGYYNDSETKLIKDITLPKLEILEHNWWDQDIPSTERQMRGQATRKNVVLRASEVFGKPPNDMIGKEIYWGSEMTITRRRPGEDKVGIKKAKNVQSAVSKSEHSSENSTEMSGAISESSVLKPVTLFAKPKTEKAPMTPTPASKVDTMLDKTQAFGGTNTIPNQSMAPSNFSQLNDKSMA